MPATLYPLVYSSGVQRDGTSFQSTYCTSAQWIRFQRDRVKKIGGMKGVNIPNININNVTNLRVYPANEIGRMITFIGHRAGIAMLTSEGADWNPNLPAINILTLQNPSDNYMWESEIVVDVLGGVPTTYIIFMLTNNSINIVQNTPSRFFRKQVSPVLNTDPVEEITNTNTPRQGITNNAFIDPLMNGNLCFASPYLFIFGSNGLVRFSNTTNPFSFTNTSSFTISADKVIYARPIRGGPNAPSLLFWTLSTVVRVTNTGLNNSNIPVFKNENISNDSSILSSKCVVEYDGFFFWPGVDRFFVYNGIVDELPNRLNQNYFFDNLDLARRQQVFGVKNAKYGEIWWFYPVKDVPGNSRAIVYNKRENYWYDTNISREAGTFSNNFGFMATWGQPINTTLDNQNYLWRHEFNTRTNQPQQVRVVDGNAQPSEPITSSFTLPIFSWVAFPPKLSKASQPSQLVNRWVDLQRVEPDFAYTANPSNFQLVVTTREYAQSVPVNSAAINFDSNTEKLDMRIQGRNMALTFSSSDNFEVGQIMLLLGLGDAR